MSSEKELGKLNSNAPVLKAALSDVSFSISSALQPMFGSSKASKFADEVTSLVKSEEFLDQLNQEIGEPTPHESEDEFVERAKKKMRMLLKARLK